MDHLDIEQTDGRSPDVTILKLSGPYSLSALQAFQSILRSSDVKHVILDFSGVTYMDSGGLGVLLGHSAQCQRTGARMALTGVSQHLRKIFEITHTDTMFTFFGTTDEAEYSFASSAPE